MPNPTDSYPQPFAAVAAVEAAMFDEAPEGFNAVQEFLGRFGYLTDDSKIPSTGPEGGKDIAAKVTGVLDSDTSTALASYQHFHGLSPTGLFDESTREMMTRSRCLLPDQAAVSPLAFSIACAWDRTALHLRFRHRHRRRRGRRRAHCGPQRVHHLVGSGSARVPRSAHDREPRHPDPLGQRRLRRRQHDGRRPRPRRLPSGLRFLRQRHASAAALRRPGACLGASARSTIRSTSRRSRCTRSATSWGCNTRARTAR